MQKQKSEKQGLPSAGEDQQQPGAAQASMANESGEALQDGESDSEDDGTPVLDEEDLEENDLSEEEADNVEWEEKKEGDGGTAGAQKRSAENQGL